MAIRDKLARAATPFLRPGEQIEVVFPAQTASNYLLLFGAIVFLIVNNYRNVVVTADRILVLDCGTWSSTKPKAVVVELPRTTRLGPATGLWHVVELNGERIRVHKRFFKDIAAADARTGSSLPA